MSGQEEEINIFYWQLEFLDFIKFEKPCSSNSSSIFMTTTVNATANNIKNVHLHSLTSGNLSNKNNLQILKCK